MNTKVTWVKMKTPNLIGREEEQEYKLQLDLVVDKKITHQLRND